MAYLSRSDIERIAENVIKQYKEMYIPAQHICYTVDATMLAEMLGFKIEYVHIKWLSLSQRYKRSFYQSEVVLRTVKFASQAMQMWKDWKAWY